MRKYIALISSQISQVATYRLEFFTSSAMVFVRYVILVSLWQITAQNNKQAEERLLVYFALSMVILSTYTSKLSGNFSKMIITGDLNNYLLRPISPAVVSFANSIVKIVIRFLSPALLFLVAIILWPDTFAPSDFGSFLAFLALFSVGTIVWNLLMLLLAYTAFWTSANAGLRTVIDLVLTFFLGSFMPAYLFPQALQDFLSLTPIKYMAAFPIDVYQGRSDLSQIIIAFLVMGFWLIMLLLINQKVYKLGLKVYDANGA